MSRLHDTTKKIWRHLDFFQHQAFAAREDTSYHVLQMRLAPRLRCRGPGSDFTLLFEAMAMTLVIHMPVAAAAATSG